MKRAVCSRCGRSLRLVAPDDDAEDTVCPVCEQGSQAEPFARKVPITGPVTRCFPDHGPYTKRGG